MCDLLARCPQLKYFGLESRSVSEYLQTVCKYCPSIEVIRVGKSSGMNTLTMHFISASRRRLRLDSEE